MIPGGSSRLDLSLLVLLRRSKTLVRRNPRLLRGVSRTLEELEGFHGQESLTFEVVPEGLNRDSRIHQRNRKLYPENLIVLQRVPQGLELLKEP